MITVPWLITTILAAIIGFLVWRRDSVWYWLGIVESTDFVLTLASIGDARPLPLDILQVDGVVFLTFLTIWVYTYKPNKAEHIRYQVRH